MKKKLEYWRVLNVILRFYYEKMDIDMDNFYDLIDYLKNDKEFYHYLEEWFNEIGINIKNINIHIFLDELRHSEKINYVMLQGYINSINLNKYEKNNI